MVISKFKILFVSSAVICSLMLIVPLSFILYQGKHSTPKQSDTIIVLGCQLWGYNPSPSLKNRLDQSLKVYNEGLAPYIIVSGGQGPDEPMTEASAMKKYLVDKGIDPEVILLEENSFNTYQNIKYSKEIMDQRGFESAIIISNDFHISRSLMIAKKFGIKASSSPAPTPSSPGLREKYIIREIPALIKDWVR
jgi:uncharacterized SAM-binding protein YcdF (DUF218 family)